MSKKTKTNSEIKYKLINIEIPKIKDDILDSDLNITTSTDIDYPKFTYGFHYFIHADKKAMEITNQFKNKKKVYHVLSSFERYVDDYDYSIGLYAEKYFGLDKIPKILSRGFFKLWELLMYFDIIDTNNDKFVSVHLAEGPGSFIQATMFYRDMFSKKSKNDKYYAITLHSESSNVPDIEKDFIKYYESEKPKRFVLHKTYSKSITDKSKDKDNGDLTDLKTINNFVSEVDQADLVTADGGFDWTNENTQEQESFKLILAQIITAFKVQAKGGNFVCKIFETFTKTSLKILSMLPQLYNKVYIIKPFTSRPSNSEKYLVCLDFKFDKKSKSGLNKKLDKLLEQFNEKNIIDFVPNYVIDSELEKIMIKLNTSIANEQVKNINSIIKFIEEQNYYGDMYHKARDEQIEASKFWIDLFFPEISNFKEAKRKCYNLLE
jgi:23S rRNA U2552 (ribose-2'-O)-methylase RlmE/FtsJ